MSARKRSARRFSSVTLTCSRVPGFNRGKGEVWDLASGRGRLASESQDESEKLTLDLDFPHIDF
jgi:hypothetical protein